MASIPYPNPTSEEQWAMDYLSWIGSPATGPNDPRVKFLSQWQSIEGNPPGTATFASEHNPLSTSEPAQGSSSINSSNVQAYPNVQEGLQATQQTMQQGYDQPIFNALLNPASTEADLQAALGSSNWTGQGATANQNYASAVAGGGTGSASTSAGSTPTAVGKGTGFLVSLQTLMKPDLAPTINGNVVGDIKSILGLPITDPAKIAMAVMTRGSFAILGAIMVTAGIVLTFVAVNGSSNGGAVGSAVRSAGEVQRIRTLPMRLAIQQQNANAAAAREARLANA